LIEAVWVEIKRDLSDETTTKEKINEATENEPIRKLRPARYGFWKSRPTSNPGSHPRGAR
jgi:hypothetical protein